MAVDKAAARRAEDSMARTWLGRGNLLLRVACLGAALGGVCAPSMAAEPGGAPHPSALCAAAVQRAEQRHQTPPGLLMTMAKVESGRAAAKGGLQPWPWTIDADGKSFFFDTKEQAVAWARGATARGVTYIDVGCMQIDLPMHPAAFQTLEDAFDPELNADYAARFLRDLRAGPASGNWFAAIGMYHFAHP